MSSCASASTGSAFFIRWRKSQIDSLYRLLRDTGVLYGPRGFRGLCIVCGWGFRSRESIPSGGAASPVTVGRSVTSGHAPSACRLRSASPCSCPATGCTPRRPAGNSAMRARRFFRWMGAACSAPFPWGRRGGSDMMHIHTLGLVRQAAEIRRTTPQLRERERIRELASHQEPVHARARWRSDSRGIVTVDQTGRIWWRRAARPASC